MPIISIGMPEYDNIIINEQRNVNEKMLYDNETLIDESVRYREVSGKIFKKR